MNGDGDGYADVLVGAPLYIGEGGAFLYLGNGGAGVPIVPPQRRLDGSQIPRLGSTPDAQYSASALGRSPFGRALVALEVESKPLGVPLDGQGTELTPYQDATVAGVDLERLVNIAPNAVHHWRARLLYDAVSSPFLQASRWFSPHANGFEEGDLRGATPFVWLGHALAGTHGEPILAGSGQCTSPSLNHDSLLDALEDTTAYFVLGLGAIDAAFKGGTLVPDPLILIALDTGPAGSIQFGLALPAGIPTGAAIYYQYWIVDDAGPVGFAASNGLRSITL